MELTVLTKDGMVKSVSNPDLVKLLYDQGWQSEGADSLGVVSTEGFAVTNAKRGRKKKGE